MRFPFGINRCIKPLWRSLVPFSNEEYGWVKYTFVSVPISNLDKSANSEPLSPVIVLKTLLNFSPYMLRILLRASVTASAVLDSIFWMNAFLVLRSRIVKRTQLLLDFSPITVSISQCPNSSRLSILLGRSEILLPSFFYASLLLLAWYFCVVSLVNLY